MSGTRRDPDSQTVYLWWLGMCDCFWSTCGPLDSQWPRQGPNAGFTVSVLQTGTVLGSRGWSGRAHNPGPRECCVVCSRCFPAPTQLIQMNGCYQALEPDNNLFIWIRCVGALKCLLENIQDCVALTTRVEDHCFRASVTFSRHLSTRLCRWPHFLYVPDRPSTVTEPLLDQGQCLGYDKRSLSRSDNSVMMSDVPPGVENCLSVSLPCENIKLLTRGWTAVSLLLKKLNGLNKQQSVGVMNTGDHDQKSMPF